METRVFKLFPQSVTVVLEGPGGRQEYTLIEMDAATRDTYLERLAQRMAIGPDGKVQGVRQFQGLQSSLLSLCLVGPTGQKVPEEEIQRWPASVVQALFEEAQRINRLAATEEPKNG